MRHFNATAQWGIYKFLLIRFINLFLLHLNRNTMNKFGLPNVSIFYQAIFPLRNKYKTQVLI